MTTDTLDRNQATAAAFVIKLSKLDPQWYGQIERQIGDVESEPYASFRRGVSLLRESAGAAASTKMGAFILTSNVEIARCNLPRAVDVLAQAVVSAILVRDIHDGERALRALYAPFESFIPLASIASART